MRIEILNKISGVDFFSAWQKRNTIDMGTLFVHVISREDLIQNKKAAGRAKDLADLEALGVMT